MKIEFNAQENCFFVTELGNIKDQKILSELKFSSPVLSKEELQKRIEFILSRVETHPELLALLEKVLNAGSLQVQFVEHRALSSSACWSSNTRTIQIAHFDSESDWVESFIFELCNADNPHFNELDKLASPLEDPEKFISHYKNAKEYALQQEKAEWPTRQKCDELLNLAYKKKYLGWKNIADYTREKDTEKDYLERVQEPSLFYHGFSHFSQYEYAYLKIAVALLDLELFQAQEKMEKLNVERLNLKMQELSLKKALNDNVFKLQNLNLQILLLQVNLNQHNLDKIKFDLNEIDEKTLQEKVKEKVTLEQEIAKLEKEKLEFEQKIKQESDKISPQELEKIQAELQAKELAIKEQANRVANLKEEQFKKYGFDIKTIDEQVQKLELDAQSKIIELEKFHDKEAKSIKKELCSKIKKLSRQLKEAQTLALKQGNSELQPKITAILEKLPEAAAIQKDKGGFNALKLFASKIADLSLAAALYSKP